MLSEAEKIYPQVSIAPSSDSVRLALPSNVAWPFGTFNLCLKPSDAANIVSTRGKVDGCCAKVVTDTVG